MSATPVLEICVDSLSSAIAAEAGGADRIELCSGLGEGGLTPSLGLLRAIRSRLRIPVHVMIRPRPGNFVYGTGDIAIMREDIRIAADNGANGVVFGILTEDRKVDVEATRALLACARSLPVTFHRAIDAATDIDAALEAILRTGADRVLTSGGAGSAWLGAETIRRLVEAAGDRIRVMVGGGVRAENAAAIAGTTGALEFHAALRPMALETLEDPAADAFGRDGLGRGVVRVADVRRLRDSLDAAFASRSVSSLASPGTAP